MPHHAPDVPATLAAYNRNEPRPHFGAKSAATPGPATSPDICPVASPAPQPPCCSWPPPAPHRPPGAAPPTRRDGPEPEDVREVRLPVGPVLDRGVVDPGGRGVRGARPRAARSRRRAGPASPEWGQERTVLRRMASPPGTGSDDRWAAGSRWRGHATGAPSYCSPLTARTGAGVITCGVHLEGDQAHEVRRNRHPCRAPTVGKRPRVRRRTRQLVEDARARRQSSTARGSCWGGAWTKAVQGREPAGSVEEGDGLGGCRARPTGAGCSPCRVGRHATTGAG